MSSLQDSIGYFVTQASLRYDLGCNILAFQALS